MYNSFPGFFGDRMPHRRPKLTAEQRQEIGQRRQDGESIKDLALEYGVSSSTIRDCVPTERTRYVM